MRLYVINKGKLEELDISKIENATINGISMHLGYNPCKIYSPMDSFDYNIPIMSFKMFTKEILFFCIDDNMPLDVSIKNINKYINEKEKRNLYGNLLDYQNELDEGIEGRVFDIEFMYSVLGLIINPNGNVISESLGLKFTFKNGLLIQCEKI